MRIYISPIMLIMAAYFVATGMAYEFVCTLSAVMLHECAHAKVAKKLGYELNVIKLMPYGAALCGDINIRARDEALIAVSGPLINIVLALLFAALWWLVPSSYMFTQAFCFCNLYIGLFNLLPVYPLDGGRVTLALLSVKLKRARAYKIMRIISAIVGLISLGLFILSAFYALNLCFLSVGIFMLVSAFIPDRRAQYTTLFSLDARRDRLKSPTEIKSYAVSENARLVSLVALLDSDNYGEFKIVDDETLEIKGVVSETKLSDAIKARGYETKIGELL